MEYVKLKRTDLAVSRVCLGTAFRAEGDDATCIATVRRTEDLGRNVIDCANAYCNGLSDGLHRLRPPACVEVHPVDVAPDPSDSIQQT